MNRIFKVIWSKTKHCYIVVSEYAKANTKAVHTGLRTTAAAAAVAAMLLAPVNYNYAWAADTVTVEEADTSTTTQQTQTVYTTDGADKTFATKADAAVQDAGVVKADKKIGENVTALGKGLYDETAARIGADAAQDKVIQKVNENLVQSVNTINKNVADGFTALNTADANEAKARTDADAAEKAAREVGDTTLDTRITKVKEYLENQTSENYVSKTDAAVQDGAIVKADKTIGENVTNLDAALAKETADRIGADAAQDKVIQQVNENAAAGIKTLTEAYNNEVAARQSADTNLQTNIDNEAAARKAADGKLVDAVNSGLSLSNDNVLQKNTTAIDDQGNVTTSKTAANEMILNKDGDNRITLSDKGIKVGLNSTVQDFKGFYAGGDNAEAAKAALNAGGSIKGANGAFTVDVNGNVTSTTTITGKTVTDGKGASMTDGTVTGKTLTDGIATITNGNISTSGTVTGGTVTSTGNISALGDIHAGGAITGASASIQSALTAGSATITGDLTAGGAIQGKSISDGTATMQNGNITGVKNLSAETITTSGDATIGGDLTVNGKLNVDEIDLTKNGIVDGNNVTASTEVAAGEITSYKKVAITKDGSEKESAIDYDENGTSTWAKATDADGNWNKSTLIVEGNDVKSKVVDSERNSNLSTQTSTQSQSTLTDKDSNTNVSTQLSYQTTEEMKAGGKTASYLRGAAEEKSQLINGSEKTTIDTIAGQTNSNITDGTNTSNDLQKADQIASSVTDGTNTTVVNQNAGSLASSITDGTKVNNSSNTVDKSEQLIKASDTQYSATSKTATKMEDALVSGSSVIDVTKNLDDAANPFIGSAVTDGTNSTGVTQTAKDITNTAEKGTIANNAKDIINNATENMTTTVGGEMKTTVTGKVTEDYKSDLDTKVGGNETHAVTGNQTVTVSKDRTVNVKGTETENFNAQVTNVKTDQRTSVGRNQTNIVAGNQQNTVSGSKTETVKGSVTEKYGSQATTVDGNQSTNVGGNQSNVVAGDQTNTISGSKTESVKGAVTETYGSQSTTVNGNQSNTVKGTLTETVTGDVTEDYKANLSTTVGGKQTTTVTGDSSLTAKNINNKATKALTNEAETITNKASESVTTQIGDGTAVKSEMTADGITNTAEGGTIYNKSKDILNEVSGDILNFADGEIGNAATKITNLTGDNTVTSDTNGTTFENKAHSTTVKEGTITKTTISGNTITTGEAVMDYADVMKDLGVRGNAAVDGNTTLGKKDADTTLTVNSKSTFKDTVKMEKTLEVDRTSNFNDKVTVTKGGLNVTGGTTTDTLHVTSTSTFDSTATFKDIVTMEKDLSVGGNATVAGDVTANSYKVRDKTYINANGINANGQKITNVAAGTEDSDAANYGQLRKVETRVDGVENRVTNVENRVDKMDSRIDKVGANAAAMANLHPLEFDEDSKWNVAAAVGNYKGETATAVGAFYRPNEDVMFNLSTTFGNDENMVGGGLSLRLGKGGNREKDKKLKAAIVENNDLRAKVNDLTARMDALLSVINPNMSKEFPDVPENHWAYEAVTRLAGNDIVQGYEDGKFHGERTMTRYEMAELIYNALSRGAKAEKKLVEEFKPELQAMAAQKQAK